MKIFCWQAARVAILGCAAIFCSRAHGDQFGGGANSFSIDFVTIGQPGNLPDTTGSPNPAGAVSYVYRIGKYEISELMIERANAASAAAGSPLGITKDNRGPDKPATRVSWFEAAKFVNWLNEDAGSSPAYKFDAAGQFQLWTSADAGYDPANPFRNTRAFYFLPSADEWYKAAFYDPATAMWFDYPNGSGTPPIPVASGTAPNTAVWNIGGGPADVTLAGGESPFGTVGQAGNVPEWDETEQDLSNGDPQGIRGVRGGDWLMTVSPIDISSSFRNSSLPGLSIGTVGFRVASKVPEPSGGGLAVLAWLIIALRRVPLLASQQWRPAR